MKQQDIKAGEEYAIGKRSKFVTPRRATVVEIRVRKTKRGVWWSTTHYERNKVRVKYHGSESEEWVTTAEVLRPWAEQEGVNQKKAEMEVARQASVEARKARGKAVEDGFAGFGITVTCYAPEYADAIRTSIAIEEMEKVLDLLKAMAGDHRWE